MLDEQLVLLTADGALNHDPVYRAFHDLALLLAHGQALSILTQNAPRVAPGISGPTCVPADALSSARTAVRSADADALTPEESRAGGGADAATIASPPHGEGARGGDGNVVPLSLYRSIAVRPETRVPAPAPAESSLPPQEQTAPEPTDVRLVRWLFEGREGVHARQWVRGDSIGYSPIDGPITDARIRSHVAGDETLGVYTHRVDNTCVFFCYDVDVPRGLVRDDRTRENALRAAHWVASALSRSWGMSQWR